MLAYHRPSPYTIIISDGPTNSRTCIYTLRIRQIIDMGRFICEIKGFFQIIHTAKNDVLKISFRKDLFSKVVKNLLIFQFKNQTQFTIDSLENKRRKKTLADLHRIFSAWKKIIWKIEVYGRYKLLKCCMADKCMRKYET